MPAVFMGSASSPAIRVTKRPCKAQTCQHSGDQSVDCQGAISVVPSILLSGTGSLSRALHSCPVLRVLRTCVTCSVNTYVVQVSAAFSQEKTQRWSTCQESVNCQHSGDGLRSAAHPRVLIKTSAVFWRLTKGRAVALL